MPFDPMNPASLFGPNPLGGPGQAGGPPNNPPGNQPGYAPASGIYSPQGGILAPLLSGGNTPQDRGYGIANPTWPMAYDTGPGLMPGTPQDIQNGDMGAAGAAETQFADLQNRYTQPGQMSQWWGQNQGQFQAPGMGEGYAQGALNKYAAGTPGVTNNSQTEYGRSLGAQPNLSANLDPFYENARRKAAEGINQQMAARGMAGGTAGMDRVAEAFTDLAADQAMKEAQYGLDRSADMRAWQGLQGSLAGQSDQGTNMASANERAWMQGLGDLGLSGQNAWLNRLGQAGQLAGNADQMDLSRMNGGMNAAQIAQEAQQGRLGRMFDQQMALETPLANLSAQTSDTMLNGDQALKDAQMAAELGLSTEAQNQSYRGAQRIKDDTDWVMSYTPMGMLGAGGGGLFG